MRKLLLTLAAAVSLLSASAQYYEVGMSVSAMNYAGDLTSAGFDPAGYRPAVGILARYNHSPRLAAKATVTLGQIAGDDANASRPQQAARNLEFRSPIYEIAAMGEFNITPYAIRNNQGAAFYLTAGISGFYFNPQARMNGEWIDLQPLGTEGQGTPLNPGTERYNRLQAAIPFGGGVKLNLTNRANLNFELLFRRTFTDYLDDVSGLYPDIHELYEENPMAAALSFREPEHARRAIENPAGMARGNDGVKDYFMTIGVTFSFNLTHKQGLDFDDAYDIFKDPPPALSDVQPWELIPRA